MRFVMAASAKFHVAKSPFSFVSSEVDLKRWWFHNASVFSPSLFFFEVVGSSVTLRHL